MVVSLKLGHVSSREAWKRHPVEQRHAHRVITTDDDGASVATTAGSRQKRQNRKSLPRRGAKVNCRC
jgi:hypothetical protein